MPRRGPYPITPALQEQIVSFIRAGATADTAAVAAGIPRDRFADLMRRGEIRCTRKVYRDFARAVRTAEAQSRVHVEVEVRKDRPLDWLKLVLARAERGEDGGESLRLWSEVLHLFGRCAEQLAPYPEARAALAGWLDGLPC